MEDMQACMLAATPGKMHQHLAKEAGVWNGKTTMFMPGAEPATSECVSTITPIMDGRYIKCEIKGDMPGMGPFEGFGIYGFDNVSQKFVSSWIDNQGTGMMNGTGELSDDGKVMSWKFTFNCPVTKKPADDARDRNDDRPEHEAVRNVRPRSEDRQRIEDDDHRVHEEELSGRRKS